MQTFLSKLLLFNFFFSCLCWDSKQPPTLQPPPYKKKNMVVEIALEMMLQPPQVFLSVRNKIPENSENLEITPRSIFIVEAIHKTYFDRKCIT